MTARDPMLVQLSKLMSLVLRHDPARFGVTLDPEGYVPVADLVASLRTQLPEATADDVVKVVDTVEPEKRRFSITDGDIRANYGHSLADRIAHPPCTPPAVLWHGTTERVLPEIRARGLMPMQRQYVHMTNDPALAQRIGSRRGSSRVLRVDAERASTAGVIFYHANTSFWLADAVPAAYLSWDSQVNYFS